MKTPQQSYPALAKALGIHTIFLKREDQHPYGSHKGRSIPHMIKTYIKRDDKRSFVISSSGNAALAAIRMTQKHNQNNPDKQITLTVFVGNNIEQEKFDMLTSEIGANSNDIILTQVDRPKQEAFALDKAGTATSLRQSTDDLALEGYTELGTELYKIPHLSAVFIPTSSGTTAQAVAEFFSTKDPTPQVHIVQTTSCHPLASALGVNTEKTEHSVASAIVDTVAHRKLSVTDVITKTQGTAWVPTDEEILSAQTLVKETTKIDISPNSALSVAGLQKALTSGLVFDGAVVCVITGR